MAQLSDPPKVSYTVEQALGATGMNRNAFYTAISQQELRTFKIGRRRMVSARALEEFIAKKEQEAQDGIAA